MTLSISFSGGSWLGMCYYLGCMSYIINHMSCENIITLGASAGSWAAFGIQLKEYMDMNKIKTEVYNLFDNVGKFPFNCESIINDFFDHTFQELDDILISKVCKNLYISTTYIEITNLIFKNNIINKIETKEMLKKSLLRSSRVPGMIGFSKHNLDGSFSNNQPIYDENTIKINCLTGLFGADIYPSEFINPIYLYTPPNIEKREIIFLMGFNDTKKYFEKLNLNNDNIIDIDRIIVI